ncbi:MAG: AAA family ATPase, partial [Bradymonadaceae bacterium]
MGSYLFVGPTGVGKTQTALALADYLFGSEDRLLRFDMSEYQDRWSAARLVGRARGEAGQLVRRVREQPFRVILLDEIEKAHDQVFDILLQVLDEGRLTDGLGQTVRFINTVLIMTSNLGAGGPSPVAEDSDAH